MYHLCDALNIDIYMEESQWHIIDNIGSGAAFNILFFNFLTKFIVLHFSHLFLMLFWYIFNLSGIIQLYQIYRFLNILQWFFMLQPHWMISLSQVLHSSNILAVILLLISIYLIHRYLLCYHLLSQNFVLFYCFFLFLQLLL